MGPPPKNEMRDLADIKFEYDVKTNLFKNADEAKEYQSLFDKYKTSKEITDTFAKSREKNLEDKKNKMDEMRKSGKHPDFAKMQEERETEEFNLLKEIKIILEKKKKDNVASLLLNEEVKCGGGKTLPVIEKVTADSMKDTSKVAKIILTEEELLKMKKDIKEEVKKEMLKEMADRPKDENRGGGERSPERKRRGDDEEEDRPRMAEGKSRRAIPGAGRARGGSESSASFSYAAQMGGPQMNMNGMGANINQMGQQMGQQMNMGNSNNQMMTRDQMIQNQIRIPQMNFNQSHQNQMGQMRRPPMYMNQNQNQNQNYAYQASYPGYAYQSNTGQYGMMNMQSNYNLVAPQMDYGYTGTNTMMPVNPGQTNYQYQQSAPSFSQNSFTGF